jgi:hypothetical protein
LKFNSNQLVAAKVYNNTFYNCGAGDSFDGAIDNDWTELDSSMVTIVNNIVWAGSGVPFLGGSGNGFKSGVFSNDLWYGASGPPPDAHAVKSNPEFVSPGSNFELAAGSPAKKAGSDTVLSVVTTNYALDPVTSSNVDIGAY